MNHQINNTQVSQTGKHQLYGQGVVQGRVDKVVGTFPVLAEIDSPPHPKDHGRIPDLHVPGVYRLVR